MNLTIKPVPSVSGNITVDPDKSLSHRAILIGSLAEGRTVVKNCLAGEDVECTLKAVSQLGVSAGRAQDGSVTIDGTGLFGMEQPAQALYLGNSGTSMRLLLGVLAGQPFQCELHGDESLSKRPMDRVAIPLEKMGATVRGLIEPHLPPMFIQGARLKPITYETPLASAQVKSAIIFAGLYASGVTTVIEPRPSRDHTERMLKAFGAHIVQDGARVSVTGPARLKPQTLTVMGDPSSAAFLLVAAIILPHSRVTVEGVNLNSTRTGFVEVLRRMGAQIDVKVKGETAGEPFGDIEASSSALKAVEIGPEDIPGIIDELPILMVACAFASGTTSIRGAGELRVKETDRIVSMAAGLNRMDAQIKELEDGVEIQGVRKLAGANVQSFGDHRTAMSLAVAALSARGTTTVHDTDCIRTSFPSFPSLLKQVAGMTAG
ncbi:MAG: 3-phosphoshikimate 1-carboxyvinyltransferase [Candidatus Omnitrophica bacterium]|nr:3-phosphoshikimate 1-carboxyvinyltransferase [Candidatus Omnitrophota bacterium]